MMENFRRSKSQRQIAADPAARGVQDGVCQVRQIFRGFREIGEPERIAQHDPQHLPAPEQRQIDRPAECRPRAATGPADLHTVRRGSRDADPAPARSRCSHLRVPDHRIGQKPAVGKNGERVAERGVSSVICRAASGLSAIRRLRKWMESSGFGSDGSSAETLRAAAGESFPR